MLDVRPLMARKKIFHLEIMEIIYNPHSAISQVLRWGQRKLFDDHIFPEHVTCCPSHRPIPAPNVPIWGLSSMKYDLSR